MLKKYVLLPVVSITLAISTTYMASSKSNKLSESDYQQLEMFGKILDKKYKYKTLSEAEMQEIHGKSPVVLVAIGVGAVTGGIDAIFQYTQTGQVNYWQVASNASAGFFGTLTGGLAVPAVGTTGATFVGAGVGGIAYNLTGMLNGSGPLEIQMKEIVIDSACGSCH